MSVGWLVGWSVSKFGQPVFRRWMDSEATDDADLGGWGLENSGNLDASEDDVNRRHRPTLI